MSQDLNTSLSRRTIIQSAGLVAGGLAIGSTLGRVAHAQDAPSAAGAAAAAKPAATTTPAPPRKVAPGDLDILNFALGLELLEQDFYSRVVTANEAQKYLHGRFAEVVPVIRDNETAHVQAITALITQLGGTPAAAPVTNFPTDVFISPVSFARFAYTLEEIGVGAYLGAISKIRSGDVRRAAASIYGSETRHAALLRHLGGFQFSPRYYEGPLTVEEVTRLIAPFVS
jgi:rubrerythrin